MVVIMPVSHFEQSLAVGPGVRVAADDCAWDAGTVALSIHNISNTYRQPRLMQELLGWRPQQRAEAVLSIRVGNRHRISTKFWEVATSVVSRCSQARPGNCQTAHGDELCGHADQTDRIASGGCGWRRTHPPPWPH